MSEPPALPLRGRRIVVTRARQQAGKLSHALQALGAEVIELPVIEIVSPESFEPLDGALRDLHLYQWLIVTSANAVQRLWERGALLGFTSQHFEHLKIAAVGDATADALRQQGLDVDLVPREYVAESLIEALGGQVAGARVLVARAAVARDVIPDELAKLGAQVDVVDAYRNVLPAQARETLRELVSDPVPDAATFTSSSTVKNFLHLLVEAGALQWTSQLRAISIGPVTSATLREHGWEPFAEATQHDVAGLIEATANALKYLR